MNASRGLVAVGLIFVSAQLGCGSGTGSEASDGLGSGSAAASAGAAPTPSGAPGAASTQQAVAAGSAAGSAAASGSSSSASPASSASTVPGARTDGCPEDMVRAAGDYCPNVEQTCVRHHEEFERDQKRRARKKAAGEASTSTVSERCLEYAPSKCLSKEKVKKDFCVDRYEWPNKKGELPALLVSWTDAKKACESVGKRLCSETEFNFACEGEAMLPYTYGLERDATKCSIDKEYRKRKKKLYPYERCQRTPSCKEHLAELDQRLPAGSLPQCVSPFGAYDMNGNINEWVEMPKKKYPDRSGLKGGWWGPVRGRCRPTVTFHKEDDYGYEEGFRCCKDAGG